MNTITALANSLQQQGIAVNLAQMTGDHNQPEAPWFVKLLAMGSGWLAAVFLTGVIAVLFQDIFRNETTLLTFGVIAIAFARLCFIGKTSDFREHLALAISLVGQILVTTAVISLTRTNHWLEPITATIFLCLHLCLLIIVPNRLHRAASGFAVGVSLGLLFSSLGWYQIYPAVALAVISALVLNEFKSWNKPSLTSPLIYGLAVQFLFPVAFHALFAARAAELPASSGWLLDLSITAVLIATATALALRYQAKARTLVIIVCTATAVGLASWELTGIAAACVILTLGCAHSNRVLLAIGVMSLLTQTSFYYYNLDATLLVKSLGMVCLGASLLAARWGLLTLFDSPQSPSKVGDEHE